MGLDLRWRSSVRFAATGELEDYHLLHAARADLLRRQYVICAAEHRECNMQPSIWISMPFRLCGEWDFIFLRKDH